MDGWMDGWKKDGRWIRVFGRWIRMFGRWMDGCKMNRWMDGWKMDMDG